MATAEKIDDRAIRTLQGLRVIESLLVKDVLVGVPHDARKQTGRDVVTLGVSGAGSAEGLAAAPAVASLHNS
jgi:hypothetical protein